MRRELPEGNIVAEYKFGNCTVKISDAAFRGVSEAELRRRREEANRIAWDIAVKHEIKRREAERGKTENEKASPGKTDPGDGRRTDVPVYSDGA